MLGSMSSLATLAIFLITATQGPGIAAQPPATPQGQRSKVVRQADVDRIVRRVLDEFGIVPGIAVGVVREDRVVANRGYGFRDVERRLPVTSQTRFSIASVTKSFTALGWRRLAEAGTIDLEASLAGYLPELTLPSPLVPKTITLRDLLTHQSGIQNDAVSFRASMTGDAPRAEVLSLFARSTPVDRKFQYSNIGYLLTALAVEQHTGSNWRDVVRQQVLEPLGLRSTSTTVEAPSHAHVAARYAAEQRGVFVRLPTKSSQTIHPAGGMVSTLDDMLRWLRFNIERGRLDGRQIVAASVLDDAHRVHVPVSSRFGGFQRVGYGLGWYVVDYDGRRMIQCFGSAAGVRAHVSFIPDLRIGVVVLTNEGREGVYLPDLIAHDIYALALGTKDAEARRKPRVEEQWTWVSRVQGTRTGPLIDYQRVVRIPEGVDASAFVGSYQDQDYGTITIEAANGGLRARMGEAESFLALAEPNVFTADFTPGGLYEPQRLTFTLDQEGRALKFVTSLGRQPSTFVRTAPRSPVVYTILINVAVPM